MMKTSKSKGCGPGETPLELIGCNTAAWREHDVFVQAYAEVTDTVIGWASSCQLLLFVLSGCTFLHLECSRLNLGASVAVCYVCVGFLGAISLAFPLLFADLCVTSLREKQRKGSASTPKVVNVTPALLVCNIVAVCAVILLQLSLETRRSTVYTYALLLVHFILALPCFMGRPKVVEQASGSSSDAMGHRLSVIMTYVLIGGMSLSLHVRNVFEALILIDKEGWSVPEAIFQGVFKSDCQLSISYDVIFTSIAAMGYMLWMDRRLGIVAALATPAMSIASTFPFFLAMREMAYLKQDMEAKKLKISPESTKTKQAKTKQ